MKLSLLGLSVVLAGALAACGDADQNTTNNGGAGAGNTSDGGGNTGGSDAGGGNTGGAGHGGAGHGGASNGGASHGGAGNGGGNTGGSAAGGGNTGGSAAGGAGGGGPTPGGPCGGIAGTPCDAGLFCDFPDDSCGNTDALGTCELPPEMCPDVYDPVCACDGKTYGNACEAAAAGVDLALSGGCPAPPLTFGCGYGFCDTTEQYCLVQASDVGGTPDTMTCESVPANCPPDGPTCACVADLPCAASCELADGLTITCPGG